MSEARMAVVLFGPPASGKTSVARQLGAWPGVHVMQMGYLLRREVERGTSLGEDLGRVLKEGRMASTESVTSIMRQALGEVHGKAIVFDGFPRSMDQVPPFWSLLRAARLELGAVLVLSISDEEVRHRLVGRRVCQNCGATYHVDYAPPQAQGRCDECGSALVHRPDDRPEVIERRLAAYRQLTMPVVAFFEQHHRKLTTRVDAGGSPEQTLERVTAVVHTVTRMR
jgi:adenylate kinase